MKTYSGSNAGSYIKPLLENAKESIWIISPWLGKEYARLLVSLSQRGVEVRIITSKVDYNLESLGIFTACENPNLYFLVLDRERPDDKATFIHAKMYLVDKKFGISGSANLTYSGLNTNVESLSIAETEEEIQHIERDFMRLWLRYEKESMSREALTDSTSYSIRKSLPLSNNLAFIDQPNIERKELVYYPYFFFEFIFRGFVRSPPLVFEDNGFLVLDGISRQIVNDTLLVHEINNKPATDYILKTDGKYKLEIAQPKISDFREARELVLNYIIKKNTRNYVQYYGNRGYDRVFVPRRYDISFIKSDFVQVPIWYLEMYEPDGLKHQKITLASSGNVWNEKIYCPVCQTKIWIKDAINCETCGKKLCQRCIQETGLIFKKRYCPSCYQNKTSR
jgi:hypothetical protein